MLNLLGMDENKPLFSSLTVILTFLAFAGSILLISIIKKIWYYFRWHKRYYLVPRVGIKGITNVAMTIALSVAIILLLTVLTSGFLGIVFRAYPGWRVNIEEFLIQLGGLLFGPVIGLFIGGLTDLLTIALTSGVFHYGYFFVCLSYGVLAGLIKSITNWVKNDTTKFLFIGTIVSAVLTVLFSLFVAFQPMDTFTIEFLSTGLTFNKLALITFVGCVTVFFIVILWLLMFFMRRQKIAYLNLMIRYNIRYKWIKSFHKFKMLYGGNQSQAALKHARWLAKNYKKISKIETKIFAKTNQWEQQKVKLSWIDSLIPVVILSVITQIVTNCFLLPHFDPDFSTIGFSTWLAFRSLIYPAIIIFDLLIIFPTYRVVNKLVKYDYQNDVLENRERAFME
ncbi:MAG: hypothetical protein L3I91_01045 [Mycoplasma sp.]